MKKIFTLLMFSFCCMWGMAQSLSFTYNGETVENGSTVISDKAEITELPPLGTMVTFSPGLCLKVDRTTEIVISLETLDEVVEICAVGDQCLSAKVGLPVEQTGIFNAGTESDLKIHYRSDFLQNISNLTAHAVVSAWYKDDESSKISINLVMSNDPAVLSVSDVKAGHSKVAYDGQNIVYAFDNDEARQLNVFTFDGRKVMETALDGREGQISLSSLAEGVYVYSIAGQSGTEKGKILVK